MNNLIEIIPSAICDMDLRALDVSSNPLVQPPIETCERGLHSMRRYYHCLKLEEMAGPGFEQRQQQNQRQVSGGSGGTAQQQLQNKKSIFQKIRKKKDASKKTAFPSSLCRSSMFRTTSEPTGVGSSLHTASDPQAPASVDLGQGAPPFGHRQEAPPIRSVSFSLSKGAEKGKHRQISDSSADTKDSLLRPPQEELDYSDDEESLASDAAEPSAAEEWQLVGLNKAEKMANEITVNDTLKVIFVGMALSGKTSIIKRLIEGKDAKIPHQDERTIGVDIYEWLPKSSSGTTDGSLMTQIPVDGELERRIKGNVDVKFSVWDFAGQHVYHVRYTCLLLPLASISYRFPPADFAISRAPRA